MRIIPRHAYQFSFSWLFDFFFSGPDRERLVKEVAEKFNSHLGCRESMFFSSARSAFVYLVNKLDFPQGSVFLLPEYGFFVYEHILKRLGYRVRFVPVRENLLLDETKLEAYIDSSTRAIIVLNLFSRCPDLEKIKKIAQSHCLIVIHDSVQSFGGNFRNRPFPFYSDFTLYSFGTGKHLPAFGGGALACNMEIDREDYADLKPGEWSKSFVSGLAEYLFTRPRLYAISVFPVFFLLNLLNRSFLERLFFEKEKLDKIPQVRCMPGFQLYMLKRQLGLYPESRKKRAVLSQIMVNGLDGTGVILPEVEAGCESDPLFLQLFISKSLCRYLLTRGIDNRYDFCRYSVEKQDSRLSVYLPLHTAMEERDAMYICRKIKAFTGR